MKPCYSLRAKHAVAHGRLISTRARADVPMTNAIGSSERLSLAMSDTFPPEMIFEVIKGRIAVTCLSCDGLHHAFNGNPSIETVNEAIAAHVSFHLAQAILAHE